MATPIEELRDALLDDPMNVLAIVGSGVSVATTGKARCASWDSLINDGIQHCSDRGVGNPEWVYQARELVRTGDFIGAAEMITHALGGHKSSGAFAQWLNDRYANFPIRDNRIITALNKLECALGTTNYDPLIGNITNRQICTWRDEQLFGQVWNPALRRVLHLHGVYDRPDTIIFGRHSYNRITRDGHFRVYLKSLFFHKTLIFVGVGLGGLGDPNFGSLLKSLRTTDGWKYITNLFVLVKATEEAEWRVFFENDARVRLVPFGAKHEDLPLWLERFATELATARVALGPGIPRLRSLTVDDQLHSLRSEFSKEEPHVSFRNAWHLICSNETMLGTRGVWSRLEQWYRWYSEDLEAEGRVAYGVELAEKAQDADAAATIPQLLIELQTSIADMPENQLLLDRYRALVEAHGIIVGAAAGGAVS